MRVVIAGGTSGIGLATAKILAKGEGEVIITGRNPGKLKQALAELPGSVRGQCVDASDPSALCAFMAATGSIDHLVLSLGSTKGVGLLKDLDLASIQEGFSEKFFPHLHALQLALPYLVRGGGSVTFITAVSGHARFPGVAGIGAVNGALETVVPILAKELQPLRVNAVSPGVIDTPWWDFLHAETRQATFSQYAQATPVGRVGQPEDVAGLIAHLIGNTFITGQVITIDGGLGLG